MTKPVTFDDQAYLAPSWQEMGELTVTLAKKIKSKGQHYHRLIALAKGGLGWARQLQDLLEIPELSSIQISLYTGIDETKKTPIVIQSLPISVTGESILVYDDVVDRGETLELAKNYLSMHGSGVVNSACHYSKPWTKEKPDFFAAETDAWLIFPHDAMEMVRLLQKKWADMPEAELASRLSSLGIDASIINLALNR